MKLAEALMERADCQTRLAELRQRLQQNAIIQEGETPGEDPNELLMEYQRVMEQLTQLVVKINQANQRISLEDGKSMISALAERDSLKEMHSMLVSLAQSAVPEQARYSRSEIKMISAVDVKTIRKQADDIAKRYRQLDILVQQANWQYDI
ncbi:MAG: DIP1984 family protein [[Actinobacillus] rossii]|nr:DIP1984 family protein [[Actinobacillus] rossii]